MQAKGRVAQLQACAPLSKYEDEYVPKACLPGRRENRSRECGGKAAWWHGRQKPS